MENFFYNDNFYEDIEALATDLEDVLAESPDDEIFEIDLSEKSPIVKLDAEWIADRIDDERFSEDGFETEYKKVVSALNECIDFEKLNSLMPTLFYGNGKHRKILASVLKDAIS